MPAPIVQAAGRRVRTLRQQQGLTIEQFANLSGLPPESISKIERGRAGASLQTLERMARGLGLEVSDLLSDSAPCQATSDLLPLDVRGVALLLVGQPAVVIEKARRIIQVLVEDG